MKSASNYTFAQVPKAEIPRSSFDRSRTYKTTMDSGYLVPFFVDEVLPGDTYNLNTTAFIRLTTPVVPFMDNLYADFFWFFVPNRLVWDNWQALCGERSSPVSDYSTDTTPPVPQIFPADTDGFVNGSLADYFGLPTSVDFLTPEKGVSCFPFRSYNLIWNEWFRDENLQSPAYFSSNDDDDDIDHFQLRRRGKRHDYFTSCLPWPQKGPGVEIPLGGSAPVIGTGMALGLDDGTNKGGMALITDKGFSERDFAYGSTIGSTGATTSSFGVGKAVGVTSDPAKSGLKADLSSATAATINSLREAFQVQKLYERDARGGTRYVEILRSHFGVISPDARLQRPEYLGGGEIPIQIHAVAQTSATASGQTAQGNLAAYGVAGGNTGFSKSFVEHGTLIGLVSIRADLTYQNGIDRMWSRKTRFDFYWPALAHLGEQAVLNKEIYAQGTSADDQVFGYQERWAEYRYGINHITGQLRSNYSSSLDVWHLAQKYTSLPVLNSSFIQDNPPVDRVLAVQNKPQFIFDSLTKCSCVRPMPVYSVPGYMDHF